MLRVGNTYSKPLQ